MTIDDALQKKIFNSITVIDLNICIKIISYYTESLVLF